MPDHATTAPADDTAVDLTEFDLDAFVDGLVEPRKVVTICRDRDLALRLDDARERLSSLEDRDRSAADSGQPTRRRMVAGEPSDTAAARAAVDDLTAQAGAAFVYVQVTGGMSRDTRRQAANDASRVDADVRVDTFNLSMLSQVARVHVTDPRTVSESPGKFLDLAGWDKFTRAIGEQQYRSILDAVEYVSAAGVEPDFSPPSSPSPAGRTSSES